MEIRAPGKQCFGDAHGCIKEFVIGASSPDIDGGDKSFITLSARDDGQLRGSVSHMRTLVYLWDNVYGLA
ncbi:hypothetical protein SBA5_110001 [Candidatus Sulfotelmatomonas gaucii]|uniref:Uncharacterized protein n=1 Tax=Candidatus Sulfuritelmatomonas gaucii TaxID=2043161 RepID=A0A2N9L353_9BACT|nr:hypothetical protein SBA5_110001 [Candidatus Sulfotelmatomonas gaucii]